MYKRRERFSSFFLTIHRRSFCRTDSDGNNYTNH